MFPLCVIQFGNSRLRLNEGPNGLQFGAGGVIITKERKRKRRGKEKERGGKESEKEREREHERSLLDTMGIVVAACRRYRVAATRAPIYRQGV